MQGRVEFCDNPVLADIQRYGKPRVWVGCTVHQLELYTESGLKGAIGL